MRAERLEKKFKRVLIVLIVAALLRQPHPRPNKKGEILRIKVLDPKPIDKVFPSDKIITKRNKSSN